MSDNTSDEEQQQQMREISICGDVWLEVFAFVSPLELGQLIMALISDRFDRLVAEHFKTRKWSLGPLQIFRPIDGNGAQIVIEPPDVNGAQIDTEPPDVNGFVFEPAGERLPIPQGPLPSKVIGFKVIEISYIDGSVIEFLQRLRRLFNSSEATVGICTFEDQSRSWDIIRQKIWPLINDNICRLVLESQLDHLRQLSPTILRNCTKLRLIDARQLFVQAEDTLIGLFPEFPADDNADASSAQAVAKWLLTRREDGRPKMLRCYDSAELEGLKRSFVNASQPVNFIINFVIDVSVQFELRNNLTRERLTFQQMTESIGCWCVVQLREKRRNGSCGRRRQLSGKGSVNGIASPFTSKTSKTMTSTTECLTQTTRKAQVSPRSEWTGRGRTNLMEEIQTENGLN